MPQNLGWLKAAVIVMGVMLIAGSLVVAVTITRKLGQPAEAHHLDIQLPKGAQILESSATPGRLLLRFKSGQDEEIRIFDLATGAEVSRVRLVP